MDLETYMAWKAAHIFGFIVWVSGLATLLHLLHVHPWVDAENQKPLQITEKRVAMLMELGSLLAIAAGLRMALGTTPTAFGTGGWLHVKLTIVVLGILGLHGYARMKVKKFSRGEIKPIPTLLFPLLLVCVAGIVTLSATTLLHK
jgi:putative membrane protein